jgi:hypothetical protein
MITILLFNFRTYLDFEMPHFKIETPHLDFETTHFKIETPYLNIETTHFKIEIPHLEFEMTIWSVEKVGSNRKKLGKIALH